MHDAVGRRQSSRGTKRECRALTTPAASDKVQAMNKVWFWLGMTLLMWAAVVVTGMQAASHFY